MDISSSNATTLNLSSKSSCESVTAINQIDSCISNALNLNTQIQSPKSITRQRTFNIKSQAKLIDSPRVINSYKRLSGSASSSSPVLTPQENDHHNHPVNNRMPKTVHKLGTIPRYLNRSSIGTMESNFALKYKQFRLKKTKFYEQQKNLMIEYQ